MAVASSPKQWKQVPVRVICRLKPTTDEEKANDDKSIPIKYDEENKAIQIYPSRGGRSPLSFEFDGILAPSTTQEQSFNVVAKDVIDDVLNGYNSTIACYGDTNSGKTHTIFGKEGSSDPSMMGMLPRCVAYCIHSIKTSPDIIEASVTISCIEVYHEQLKDLISPSASSKLKIRISPSGETYVENLTQQFMQSAADALKMLEVIKLNRTKMSEFSEYSSPRSHSLACLTVRQKLSDNSSRKAKCFFADFAGSDLLDDASLGNLRLVIHSLVAQKSNIAYNASAVTQILREAFGGNAKLSLIICCSMHILQREEAIKSLRFGQRARLIVNRIKSNKELSRNDMRRIIKKQEALICDLQSQINLQNDKVSQQNHKNESELKQKYDKLLKQHSMDKVKYMAQNDELQDLQHKNEDLLQQLDAANKQKSEMNAVCIQRQNKIIALQQENANYIASNDSLHQKLNELTQQNEKLQNISSTILDQLQTLEKELEIQQDAIKCFEETHSRGSVHRRLSDGDNNNESMDSLDVLTDANCNDMARGSVIIHTKITLPLSTTTPSTSPNNQYDDDTKSELGFPLLSNHNSVNKKSRHLEAVNASHIKIKQSLVNLRELLETNFASASASSKGNNKAAKKAMTQLVNQYNNVMVCSLSLQSF